MTMTTRCAEDAPCSRSTCPLDPQPFMRRSSLRFAMLAAVAGLLLAPVALIRKQHKATSMPRLSRNRGASQIFVDGELNGDDDNQGRYLRMPTGEFTIRRIRLYHYPAH